MTINDTKDACFTINVNLEYYMVWQGNVSNRGSYGAKPLSGQVARESCTQDMKVCQCYKKKNILLTSQETIYTT